MFNPSAQNGMNLRGFEVKSLSHGRSGHHFSTRPSFIKHSGHWNLKWSEWERLTRELVMEVVLRIVRNGSRLCSSDDESQGGDGWSRQWLGSFVSELEGWLVEDESLNGDGELKMMEARWSEKKIVDYGGVWIERDSKKKRAKDGLNKRLVSN
ncbi:hypothetical protein V6N13_050685 [Hibiscus sabdariffa]|uniref:Uncharacterized protein n=1 Tax=Hibiscus sabdariffa TaxID=183260 RepID=A0ABR2PI27_9ROSI